MICPFCRATVADMAHHYAHDCRALIAAFDGDTTDPLKSARQTAARVRRANGQCARCGGGPRVANLSYCRHCKRQIGNASRTARRAANRHER